ncbi:hypothetical protein H6F49_23155 [Nodosilinea sp. FACHB-13]|nr:hypothetical protein [Nodosilinea sp. FACHB-13]
MTALTFPLEWGTAWRVGLLQQMGDRSIVLLIGVALLIYSAWENQSLRKMLGFLAMGLGTLFLLICMFVVRESFLLHSQAIDNIGNQVSQLQTQVEAGRSNPEVMANATEDDFANALRAIDTQAETLRQNAKTTITRSAIASTSNFAVVGIGLLSLGRLGSTGKYRGRSAKKTRK